MLEVPTLASRDLYPKYAAHRVICRDDDQLLSDDDILGYGKAILQTCRLGVFF